MKPWKAEDRTEAVLLWLFWGFVAMAFTGTVGGVVVGILHEGGVWR